MTIRFYLDPETEQPHIYGNAVDEGEVIDVLTNPGEDRPGREGSRVAIGKKRAGRYLRVIDVPDPGPDRVFVITAYELRGKPLTAYRPRRRLKGKQRRRPHVLQAGTKRACATSSAHDEPQTREEAVGPNSNRLTSVCRQRRCVKNIDKSLERQENCGKCWSSKDVIG